MITFVTFTAPAVPAPSPKEKDGTTPTVGAEEDKKRITLEIITCVGVSWTDRGDGNMKHGRRDGHKRRPEVDETEEELDGLHLDGGGCS